MSDSSAEAAASGMVADWLGSDGRLARRIDGFSPRLSQLQMATAVEAVLADGSSLVVEAGTGTGKTFAYLVPALLSGRRVVVSTGTRNLQDQLFLRDLPRLCAALDLPVRTSLLKGRGNYLCLQRLERVGQTPGWRYDERIDRLRSWSRGSDDGDLSRFGALPEADPLYARVTSNADNCLGAKCPQFSQCFVVKARRAAQSADLVVVNHHLLLADFALRQEGFGEILPGADAVIVDEAHQLPELASQFFGHRLSTRQLRDLCDDTLAETQEWGDLPDLVEAAEALTSATLQMESLLLSAGQRMPLQQFCGHPQAPPLIDGLRRELAALQAQLAVYQERSVELAALEARGAACRQRLDVVLDAQPASDDHRVRWVEPRGRGGVFNATPTEVAEEFGAMRRQHRGAWVLTSATLSAAGDFSHFCGQLGLDDAQTLLLDSPFDYARQARMWVVEELPDPNAHTFPDAVARCLLPVIAASGGGVFVLCTSHRNLRIIAERLGTALASRDGPAAGLPLFVQGEGPRAELVERFAATGNGVLVGTSSFWEGVDVRGTALRVVAIDRLPFAAPGDPVLDARLDAARARGLNPFVDVQLPQAITALRQGVGRLIRDTRDQGLLVLCDPRLLSKAYGRRILAALPPMSRVDQRQALDWARALRPPAPQ